MNIHQDQVVLARLCGAHALHRSLAVVHHVQVKAGALEDLNGDLLVELIVLRQEDFFARKGDVRGGGELLLATGDKGRLQQLPQLGQEDGLGAEGGDPGIPGLLLNIRPVVCGEDDNGFVLADDGADAPHHLHAVHVGHEPVDDKDGVLVPLVRGQAGAQHRLLAGGGPIRAHTDGGQHFGDAGAGVEIVVRHQRPQPLELGDLLLPHRAGAGLEVEGDGEGGALALLAGHGDGAAHHVHNVFGDGHAKPRALDAADGAGPLPLKGVEDVG